MPLPLQHQIYNLFIHKYIVIKHNNEMFKSQTKENKIKHKKTIIKNNNSKKAQQGQQIFTRAFLLNKLHIFNKPTQTEQKPTRNHLIHAKKYNFIFAVV